jgi:N-acetyltransferase
LSLPGSLLADVLDSLDLSRAEPGIGFLEALFARFNARVPFENASKILRHAEVEELDAKPRTPGIFWAEHLERGTGGTCFARVAAFDALLSELGFSSRRVLGRVEEDADHAALMVQTPAGEILADVGFPLAVPLPTSPATVETPLGDLRVERTARGLRVRFLGGVPEGPRSLEVFDATASPEEYEALWRRTFRAESRFLRRVGLRRDLGHRGVSFAAGEVRVDDRHSRLRVPILGRRDRALAELFGIDAEVLARAFSIVGDPEPTIGEARLTAYLQVDATPSEAFGAIASPAGYRRLSSGVADVLGEEETASGFRLRLSPPGAAQDEALEEEVAVDLATRQLSIERRLGGSSFRSAYKVYERDGATTLLREATLSGPREDLLRNDSLRGRLAGTLAVDLLAWARML